MTAALMRSDRSRRHSREVADRAILHRFFRRPRQENKGQTGSLGGLVFATATVVCGRRNSRRIAVRGIRPLALDVQCPQGPLEARRDLYNANIARNKQ